MSTHHKRLLHCLTKVSAKERRLFWIRFLILTLFALLSLVIGLFAKEIEHLTFALIGVKFCDTCGEALAEAIASVEE